MQRQEVLGQADLGASTGVWWKKSCLLSQIAVQRHKQCNKWTSGKTRRRMGVVMKPEDSSSKALDCLDRSSLLDLIKVCGKQKDLHTGSRIHATVVERGLLKKDIALGNALLSMYAKCGALAKAKDLFNQLPCRKVVTWNALIAGFAQHGLLDEALTCLGCMRDEGLSPNAITFISILKACGIVGAIEKGEQIHAEVDKQGYLEDDITLGNALVDMYVKCGLLTKALAVLEKLPIRDVVSWNSLIAGYTQHGLNDEALGFFKKMHEDGISPDSVTFICVLKACGSIKVVEKGEAIHAEVSRQGLLRKNVVLGTALVDMYVNCGMVAKAQEVFDSLSARDAALWTALISGYANQGLGDEALACFRTMQDEGFSPDALTYVCILKACGTLGAAKKGRVIHKEVDRQGLLARDVMLGTALVDMYAKCGELTKAHKVFDELPVQFLATWTVLIAGYAQVGNVKRVFDLFTKMREEGLKPDVVTFVVLLTGCSHAGLLEEAQLWFETMSSIYMIVPTMEHHACMVDAFSRAGHFDRAMSMIKEVPPSDCLLLWSTVLGACREQIYVEVGRRAFDHAVQLEKNCAAAYVSMSNVYAAVQLQAEVL